MDKKFCLFLSLLVFAACAPMIPRGAESALVIEDLLAGERKSRLKEQTDTPARIALDFPDASGAMHEADLYRPSGSVRGAVVLVPGVERQGKENRNLVAFANTLARVNFLVLVPDIAGFREDRARASDSARIAAAVRFLADHPELPRNTPLGAAGISFAVGPVALAAMDRSIRDRIDFVLGIGGYFDMRNVVSFITTGRFRNGEAAARVPRRDLKWTFGLGNVDLLDSPSDRNVLRTLFRHYRNGGAVWTPAMRETLGPEGRALLALLENDDPARVDALIDALPPSVREEIDALSVSGKNLANLRADVILIHGKLDNLIPPSESVALAEALKRPGTRLFLIDGMAHIEFASSKALPELMKAVDALLARRTPVP